MAHGLWIGCSVIGILAKPSTGSCKECFIRGSRTLPGPRDAHNSTLVKSIWERGDGTGGRQPPGTYRTDTCT